MDYDKLVEEVARAIFDDDVAWAALNDSEQAMWRPEARAALAIIRPAVIEECAKKADEKLRKRGVAENNIQATCAAIRALAKPATGEEKADD